MSASPCDILRLAVTNQVVSFDKNGDNLDQVWAIDNPITQINRTRGCVRGRRPKTKKNHDSSSRRKYRQRQR
jgi:hypothetical protein